MSAVLMRPSPALESSYRAYIAELGDEERYPFVLDFDHADFPALLARVEAIEKGIDLPEGLVPSSTYWFVGGGEILGVSNLRHRLNERIRHCGGHIGLGLRPTARGRGLGTVLMAQTIKVARARGIGTLHIHCHGDNPASAGMIIANGGRLDSEVEHGQPPRCVQRFEVAAPPGWSLPDTR